MLRLAQFLLYLPFKILFPTKIKGKENLKPFKKKAVIFSMNHTSNLDAVLFVINTWEKKYFLAKKELFKNKCFGALLKNFGAIKIDRQSSDVTAIKNCLKVLKDNKKLVIFPEGTRVHNEDMSLGEVKHGIAMFAIKSRTPIVPMFINHKPRIFRRTTIVYGKPFTLGEFYGKKLDATILDEASQIVAKKMDELRENYFQSLTKKK